MECKNCGVVLASGKLCWTCADHALDHLVQTNPDVCCELMIGEYANLGASYADQKKAIEDRFLAMFDACTSGDKDRLFQIVNSVINEQAIEIKNGTAHDMWYGE
jgi:hypothetical protein